MAYTFAKVTLGYAEYLESLYSANPEMMQASYDEQQQFIFRDGFGEADYMQSHLESFGVEAFTIIANCTYLQEAWARERGLSLSLDEILTEQLRELNPTILFIHNCYVHDDSFIEQIKAAVPSIALVIGWCGIGFTEEWAARWTRFDAILTCNPAQLHDFERVGIRTGLINHGFEKNILDTVGEHASGESYDVLFTGSLIASNGYHQGRINLLTQLVRAGLPLTILSKPLPNRESFPEELLPHIKPPLYGMEMLAALGRAKIVFNSHLDANRAYAGNFRLFEATGMGACLLTDAQRNIDQIFVPNKEIVTYAGVDECLEKALYLLEHPAERKSIAQAGQKRTLSDYTYAHRARSLHAYILDNIG